jgi:hypothetical protein
VSTHADHVLFMSLLLLLRLPQCCVAAALLLSWQRVVEAYEADKQELQQDNAALRKALHDLQVR